MILFVIIIVVFLFVIAFFTLGYQKITGFALDTKTLSQNQMLKDMPNNGEISIQLGDEFYTIKTSTISGLKSFKPDISVYIPASYESQLKEDICSLFKKASQNKDIKITLNASKISLLWKYRRMLKYRSCFGFW